ncbi:MAG TPA: ATP phosphoribosyltransferase [Egibacteraceae bacterium]|nr:ATP phosphoribosyltransferase [Actinomycetota bacterium]HWB72725.1 ATP phosphoribosyltransferase [Egibacteraceae bacterium]
MSRQARLAVPSGGRLRDGCLTLLAGAGYATGMLHGAGSIAAIDGLEFIEMRPRDAAAALAAGQLDAAFLATDIVAEHDLADLPALPLGFSRSELVVASRDDDGRHDAGDLHGAVVATHMPRLTERFFARKGIDVTVVAMGGALEGVCAAGLADAIVDLRETGTSLMTNRLRVLEVVARCEALFVRRRDTAALDGLTLRLEAVLTARRHRYVMLHLPRERLETLRRMFPGLESPTVLPLAGREDLVAVHFVVAQGELWSRLGDLRVLGATGIVALELQALLA